MADLDDSVLFNLFAISMVIVFHGLWINAFGIGL